MTSHARGATRLVVEATREMTSIVEAMHVAIASGPWMLGRPLELPVKLATRPVYGAIRAITALVGAGLDRLLAALALELPVSTSRDAFVAAANGVAGDYLEASGNPLAIQMSLRTVVPASGPTGKVLVLVHGSSMSDHQWVRDGHDHGAALARDLGFTPVYVRYNSGRHISTNGAELATQLATLLAAWPVPVDDLVLLGHSMGGLVARSALHAAASQAWRGQLRALVTLGTPHHGAPLERSGSWLQLLLGVHRYSAPLARLARVRSAGVTDLRYGLVLDEHWQGRDRFAVSEDPRSPLELPERMYVVAGALSDRRPSDGIVPVASALGEHATTALSFALPAAHRFTAAGVGHIDLLSSPAVYDQLRSWLA